MADGLQSDRKCSSNSPKLAGSQMEIKSKFNSQQKQIGLVHEYKCATVDVVIWAWSDGLIGSWVATVIMHW